MVRIRPLALAATLLAIGCTATTPLRGDSQLHGRVSFATAKLKTQAQLRTKSTSDDIVNNATVSLVKADKTTVATGVTDSSGQFTLTIPTPAAGDYQVIAAKRVNGDGRLLQLTSMVNYDGSTWDSLTSSTPDIMINPATTAVTLVAKAYGGTTASLLQKISLNAGSGQYEDISATAFANPALDPVVQLAKSKVTELIGLDIDPLRGVSYVDLAGSDATVPSSSATPGLTRLKIQGFGFDPVPARNAVGLQYGSEIYWSPALPGSTTTTLFARTPVVPPSVTGVGYQAGIPVVVRNGANALSFSRAAGTTLTLFYPWRVPDASAKLPVNRATTLGSNRFVSTTIDPSSGLVYSSWQDQRYASNATDYAPVLRAWNWTSNALASFDPRVSDPFSPSLGSDPSNAPLVLFQAITTPASRRVHVLWQGTGRVSGTRSIFHRILADENWMTPAANLVSSLSPIGNVAGNNSQNYGAPNAVIDNGRIAVVYPVEYASGRFNVQTKVWNGTIGVTSQTPDWSGASSLLHTSNGPSSSASFPQIALGGTGTNVAYHVLWHNMDPTFPAGASLQYRVGQPAAAPGTGITWTPNTASQPIVYSPNVGPLTALTMAADKDNTLLTVYMDNGPTPIAKLVPASISTAAAIQGIPGVTVPPLPGNAPEVTPQVIAVGSGDFYLITASSPTAAAEVAGDIWIRRCFNGTWGQPLRVFASPGVLSECPNLSWNGTSLTASWIEGRGPVILPVIVGL